MIEVELPFPPPELNPNRSKGRHWTATHELRNRCLAQARYATAQAMKGWVPPVGNIPLDVTFVMPDRRRRDRDNLAASCKHFFDGVAQALGIDDNEFEPITLRREYGKKPGAVILRIGQP